MKSRNERVHHKERLKAKRRFCWGQDLRYEENDKYYLAVDTPKPCSCAACGNPRKYNKERTLQEKSFDEVSKI